MSDESPRKLTVEDLVRSQQQTQEALEKIVERLDMVVEHEAKQGYGLTTYNCLFVIFGFIFLIGCVFSEQRTETCLAFISFCVFSIAVDFHQKPRASMRKLSQWKNHDDLEKQKSAEQWRRDISQVFKYQARIKSAISSSRWFPTNWR
jgi:hypothetical protein